MKLTFQAFLLIFLLFSCSDDSIQINEELSHKLVGEWHNVALRLDMPTYKNTDSSGVFEVADTNWEAKMRIRPIRTNFRINGTYNSEHRNLKDSIIYNPAGNWMIVGDTLHMIDTFPERGPIYKFKVRINGSTAEFWGQEDCDRDGKTDDFYYGKQVKAGN